MAGITFDISEENFIMAFAIEDYTTSQPRIDPRFVKWNARYIVYTDNEITEEKLVTLVPCTEIDFARFNPVEIRSQDSVKKYKEEGGMFCLDWDKENFKLFGTPSDANHSVIDISVVPCGLSDTVLGGTDSNIRDDCNWDRAAAIEYIGDFNLVCYFNKGRFISNEYQDEPVERRSYIHKIRPDQNRPNWYKTFVHSTEVLDDSAFIQWGQQDDITFYDVNFQGMLISSYSDWPEKGVKYEAPAGRYKFSSLALYLDQDETIIERQTYSMLDWLGDIGGLADALHFIAQFVVEPFVDFALQVKLMQSIFVTLKNKQNEESEPMLWNFTNRKRINSSEFKMFCKQHR